MSIDTAIYARIVSGGVARVYPPPIPDSPTYPLVVYFQVTGNRGYVMEGADGLATSRFQCDCWAEGSVGARAIAEAVRGAMSGFKGASDGVDIQSIFLTQEQKLYDDDAQLHRVIQEYRVTYREAV